MPRHMSEGRQPFGYRLPFVCREVCVVFTRSKAFDQRPKTRVIISTVVIFLAKTTRHPVQAARAGGLSISSVVVKHQHPLRCLLYHVDILMGQGTFLSQLVLTGLHGSTVQRAVIANTA